MKDYVLAVETYHSIIEYEPGAKSAAAEWNRTYFPTGESTASDNINSKTQFTILNSRIEL